MAVDSATVDKVTNWYQTYLGRAPEAGAAENWANMGASGGDAESFIKNSPEAAAYAARTASTAAPASSGMLSPGASAAAATASGSTSSATPDVGNWYRSVLGRDAEKGGLDYWNKELQRTGDVNGTYATFMQAAKENSEQVNDGRTWEQASRYEGPQSVNRATPVDDWFRNTMGREATPGELATWQGKFDAAGAGGVDGARDVYGQFLNAFDGEVKSPMDMTSASQINSGLLKAPTTGNSGLSFLDLNELDRRTIDPATETVRGQMTSLLKEDSPYMAQARYDAMKQAAERGMLNTTMAASAGEDAAIRSALNIATPDAGYYNKASDYNTAIRNESRKWNAEQANQFALSQQQFFNQAELQRMQQGHQLTLAQLQDGTDRWKTMVNDATSRYNTDSQYKNQADNNKKSLVNNVMMNMELSPDRKAAMLEALGEGTSAKRGPDGKIIPGTGLAGAVYIISEVGDELRQALTPTGSDGGGGNGGGDGGDGGGDGGDGGE